MQEIILTSNSHGSPSVQVSKFQNFLWVCKKSFLILYLSLENSTTPIAIMDSSVINSWIFYPTSNGFLVVTLINNYTLYYRLISVIFFQKQLPSQISQQMLIHIIIISFVYRQLFTKHTWNWVQKFVSWQNLYIYMQSSTWQYKE